jgi:hypothetical protein
MEIYYDETNKNVATQFVTVRLLTRQVLYKCSIWLPRILGVKWNTYLKCWQPLCNKLCCAIIVCLVTVNVQTYINYCPVVQVPSRYDTVTVYGVVSHIPSHTMRPLLNYCASPSDPCSFLIHPPQFSSQ